MREGLLASPHDPRNSDDKAEKAEYEDAERGYGGLVVFHSARSSVMRIPGSVPPHLMRKS